MISYSQRDLRWSKCKIGQTEQTIGRVGCLITSLSDLSSFFGKPLDPDVLSHICTFDKDARLLWYSADFPSLNFLRREREYVLDRVAAAVQSKDLGVVLEVDGGAHWVRPIRWNVKMDCWDVLDPWFGDEIAIETRYKRITGAAFFERK